MRRARLWRALACYPPDEAQCVPEDDFHLRFFDRDLPENEVVVSMSEPAYGWPLEAGQVYSVFNLRAFQTGNCDDYWDWAYYVTRTPIF